MDKLTAMRSFIEVAKSGSFSKAAELQGLSRLQVSRHVQEIELWLQQRLLHRTTRKVTLTSAGEDVLKRCEYILYQTTQLEVQSLQGGHTLQGTIRIAAPIGLAQNLLIAAVTKFSAQHPKVIIDILVSDRNSQLVDERIDIALRFTEQPDEQLIARRLMSIGSVICASPKYLATHPQINDLDELVKHNCLIHCANEYWTFIHENQQYKVKVAGNIRANDLVTLTQAALADCGIVYLPCDLANPLIASKRFVRVLSDYHCADNALWAVYLSRSYQTPLVRQFIDFIAEHWQADIVPIK
ncbi:LysR family transcriptional regulator [Pseudoalteromonas tunicata]|uniref:Transcriptional regulator, LysR family protein n=1 Tax=Pseudoalteromonas tunicata D2 TaxID=87626 RepID=A4CB10_9GAMM|nr:LysR family transcriptional regulator [Pseudoalteromonas tunicata]ATC95111.1 hypothetical protein PTUN_a2658 [Pseudoalteromonas tunicata]AXT30743.1 LysR family transcriptional regulator [Pseudoalteromonas tunicata]EAR28568.1 transcriptional regulator, LysR family protein [Pseudoalteromonas tunicata D2]MDP4985752.1 LysR family transcriptional regulator [Pseudoalteromonas tunicata]